MKDQDYGTPLWAATAQRASENRMRVTLDADGYVVRGELLQGAEGDFVPFMRAQRRVVDAGDIVMNGWAVDGDGRGLTLLEVQRP